MIHRHSSVFQRKINSRYCISPERASPVRGSEVGRDGERMFGKRPFGIDHCQNMAFVVLLLSVALLSCWFLHCLLNGTLM